MSDKAEKLFNAMNKIDDGLIGSALDCDGPGKLNNAITNIDDDIIEAALAATPETVKAAPVTAFANRPWVKWAAAAAVFVIVAAAPFAMYKLGVFRSDNIAAPDSNVGSENSGVISSAESDSGNEPENSSASGPDNRETSSSGSEGNEIYNNSSGRTGEKTSKPHNTLPQQNSGESSSGTNGTEQPPVISDDPNDPEIPPEQPPAEPEEGEFIKDNMPEVTYMIAGENKTFAYLSSTRSKKAAEMDLDGNGGSCVIDHYIGSDGSIILKNESSDGLMQYEKDALLVDVTPGEKISTEDAIEAAESIVVNTDLPIGGLDNMIASVRYSSERYYVTFKTADGNVEICLDKFGSLQYLTVKRDALQQLSRDRIIAARTKMHAELETLEKDNPDERYVLKSMHFEEWGDKIYAVFDVDHYPDKYSDMHSVFQYYCVV